ncbi:hypothetical protein [Phytomonospora endophytica]|uniref:Uncharacterized protein n=1 Tax=Phytomonospora endophytica TaxID=714109 RepID=A0A841FUV9_9ACTN|nr:hypothetical protein [Phytomonospora endophytica]MBB6039554.1 hypothetical protein [Phytomonospora endophytica]GIG70518.1 hypothetical protein Pen01_68130 [Phytomonospora endophytica]
MRSDDDLLNFIRQDRGLTELLSRVCEFDLTRGDHGEPVRFSSGLSLEGIAGDFTGGTIFLCGDHGPTRPVLYAGSEGQAGVVGRNLAEVLEVLVGLPSWWDCLKFSGGGDLAVMQVAAEHLERDEHRDEPGLRSRRAQAVSALSLETAPVPELLARLRDAVLSTEPDYVLIVETGEEYESLFGPWLPSRNPMWR